VVNKDNCTVYTSATFTTASGYQYAVATGTAGDSQTPAHAEIDLTNDGSCPP
jgi:hypothetical protein